MTFYQSLETCIKQFPLQDDSSFYETYKAFLEGQWNSINGKKFRQFFEPLINSSKGRHLKNLNSVCFEKTMTDEEGIILKAQLKSLGPWRKGPFQINDFIIDSEWRSELKWARLAPFINDLVENKQLIDVGCGSGYYMYRASTLKPKVVLGIDPSLLFNFQFHALQHIGVESSCMFLQQRLEDIAVFNHQFDTVLCMGVLYHRRDPLTCLRQLKALLKDAGSLVLETLIIDSDEDIVLNPDGRYAKMPNVHYIPSIPRLLLDCEKAGFCSIEVRDITQTSINEQRATEWSTPTSLSAFLDPENSKLTIEGYPAPTRAVLTMHC